MLVSESKSVMFKQLEVNAPVTGTHTSDIIHLPTATIEVADGTSQATVETVLLALKCLC